VHEIGNAASHFVTLVLDRIEVPMARKTPIIVNAAVYEGGHRVATHAIRIPAGEAGIVPIGQVVFDGLMFDNLQVKLLDGNAPGGPILRHERSWDVLSGHTLGHVDSIGGSDAHHESSWRVWFHVVNKPGLHR